MINSNRTMATELTDHVNQYIQQVICGFESGIYKMVSHEYPDRLKHLTDNHQPFITIFRDLHENYYTSTFNSIVKRDDDYVVKTFDKFYQLTKHSLQCVLTILANLIVSIHFNLDRKKLNYRDYNSYMKTLKNEISIVSNIVNISKLFDHKCSGPMGIPPANNELKELPKGEKFITIKMSHNTNGIDKEIKSFTDQQIQEN